MKQYLSTGANPEGHSRSGLGCRSLPSTPCVPGSRPVVQSGIPFHRLYRHFSPGL